MKKYRYVADTLTFTRIVSALLMLIPNIYSASFYILYLFCGVTDMLDGHFARKSGSLTSGGALLDSIADLFFIGVCLYRITPTLNLSVISVAFILFVAAVRLANILTGWYKYGRLVLLHTVGNKLTGFLLFLLPLCFSFILPDVAVHFAAFFALLASLQEGFFILTGRNINYSDKEK